MVVTFFGSKDAPLEIGSQLRNVLVRLIEKEKADTFYVGDQGPFDRLVRQTLKDLKTVYPQIHYSVVIAYLNKPSQWADGEDYSDAVFPAGIAASQPKVAILNRNLWMIKHADTVVTYVTNNQSHTNKFIALAKKQGKRLLPLEMV